MTAYFPNDLGQKSRRDDPGEHGMLLWIYVGLYFSIDSNHHTALAFRRSFSKFCFLALEALRSWGEIPRRVLKPPI